MTKNLNINANSTNSADLNHMDNQRDNQIDDTAMNQTDFAANEVLFSDVSRALTPEEQAQEDLRQAARKKMKRVLVIFAVGVVTLCSSVVWYAVTQKPGGPSHGNGAVATASPSPTPSTQLEQELSYLEGLVRQADPSHDDLPFPPVDLNLSVEGR